VTIARILVFARAAGIKNYVLLFASSVLLLCTLQINLGIVEGLYQLPEAMVYPQRPATPHYLAISSYSLAPFTSVLDVRTVEKKLAGLAGIERVVYEVLTPVVYGSCTYILRGLRKEDLEIVAGGYSVVGEGFEDTCLNCLWVGSGIAEELGLRPGDTVVLYSIFTSSSYVFTVRGVMYSDSPLSREFVTTLTAAQAVRGVGPGQVSVVLVFASDSSTIRMIAESFGVSAERLSLVERGLLALRYAGGSVNVSVYRFLLDLFMSRLGLSRDVLTALQLAVAAITALGFYYVGAALIAGSSEELKLLNEQGLPIRSIRALTAILALLTIAAADAVCVLMLRAVSDRIGVEVLGYRVTPRLDPALHVLSAIPMLAAVMAGIWTAGIKYEEE